jgi:hypothetical protein
LRLYRETDAVLKKIVDSHKNIDKCNKMLCLSPRNMIDKTIFEILIDSLNQSEILYLFAFLLALV